MIQTPWKLIWQDDFDRPQLDPTKWQVDEGYTGESNGEWEIYTTRPKNLSIKNGCLVITARKEEYDGFHFTSARVKTGGLHAWTYGRFEARIKIPRGPGLWPAFWMLGEDISSIGWPECGEIDIMEALGARPEMARGTLHGPGYARDESIGKDFILPGIPFADDFHCFSVEWEPDRIHFFVDTTCYNTLTVNDIPGRWVFDHPFFILLNVAVGGLWPGYPDETTRFPQSMYIDYVRVYEKNA